MAELIPGVVEEVLPGIRRLVAPNPSVMTGPGTNTYLLGQKRLTLLDPGPNLPDHLQAIKAAIASTGGQLERIVVTHTHTDHSPAVAPLASDFGVPVHGCSITDDGYQDRSFRADLALTHGECLAVDDTLLEAIHTPGHVDNHYCFLHHASGAIFTGDHIMQGSTVVIIPPSGDMADYLASLKLMLNYPMTVLAPGHGTLIDEAKDEVMKIIAHRQGRENKIVAAMTELGPVAIDTLLLSAYGDVPPSIHQMAKLSLLAHLLKLQKEQRAGEQAGVWRLLAS